MVEISYAQMVLVFTFLWVMVRALCCAQNRGLDLKREGTLLLVYLCIVVVIRFTFCPFGRVDGKIQPLVLDPGRIFPLWVNLVPFVYLFDYDTMAEAWMNLVGNIAMFVPLGVIWPGVFPQLDRPWKVIAAGAGVSACIEVLQLPFFNRATDIDDLILNTAGFLVGYGVYRLWKKLRKNH